MEQYSILILGIPTWDFGVLQEDLANIWPHLTQLNLRGKIVALYGMGDQIDYREYFLDALGMLYHHIAPLGVQFIGFWPTEGFEFSSPKPLTTDGKYFVGLALDEVNQYYLSEKRIQQWCEQILLEIEPLL